MAIEQDPSSSSQNSPEPHGLLYILLFSSGLFLLSFLSKLRNPIRQSTNSSHRHDNTNYRRENSGNSAPSRGGFTETNRPPTPPQCNYPQNKPKHWLKRWKLYAFVLNLVTFIAVALYACITRNMWKEMQIQSCLQREASTNAERAWVGLDKPPEIEIGLLPDGRLGSRISVIIKNYGKGPGVNTVAGAMIVPSKPEDPHWIDDETQNQCNLIFPFVGLKPTRPVATSFDSVEHQWGETLFANRTGGSDIIGTIDLASFKGKMGYLVGCIAYKDQFSNGHWTKFCYNTGSYAMNVVKDANSFKHLQPCGTNNYTDDVEKKPNCPLPERQRTAN